MTRKWGMSRGMGGYKWGVSKSGMVFEIIQVVVGSREGARIHTTLYHPLSLPNTNQVDHHIYAPISLSLYISRCEREWEREGGNFRI